MVSDNFTERRQNGPKLGTRDKFATHLRKENFIQHDKMQLFANFKKSCEGGSEPP